MTLAYIPEYLMFLALRKFRTEGGDGNFYFFKTMGRAKDCSCYCCLIENNDTQKSWNFDKIPPKERKYTLTPIITQYDIEILLFWEHFNIMRILRLLIRNTTQRMEVHLLLLDMTSNTCFFENFSILWGFCCFWSEIPLKEWKYTYYCSIWHRNLGFLRSFQYYEDFARFDQKYHSKNGSTPTIARYDIEI